MQNTICRLKMAIKQKTGFENLFKNTWSMIQTSMYMEQIGVESSDCKLEVNKIYHLCYSKSLNVCFWQPLWYGCCQKSQLNVQFFKKVSSCLFLIFIFQFVHIRLLLDQIAHQICNNIFSYIHITTYLSVCSPNHLQC